MSIPEPVVFTEERIEKIKSGAARNTFRHRLPEIYRVATDPNLQSMRGQIENWVKDFIPQASLEAFISQLCFNNFRTFYNELVVAQNLKRLGYTVTYQTSLENSKTPDWYAENLTNEVQFYVEVFTPSPDKNSIESENKWIDLCTRIENQKLGFGVQIIAGRQCMPPDANRSKRLATLIRKWLSNEKPSIADYICFQYQTLELITDEYQLLIDGIKFEVIEKGLAPESTWCLPPSTTLPEIRTETLKDNIQEKTNKYGRILADKNIPFIIVLVPHPDSLHSHDSLEEALYGQLVTKFYRQADNSYIRHNTRLRNGIFTGNTPENALLSAVIWLQKTTTWEINSNQPIVKPIQTYLNPNAISKISLESLDLSQLT